MKNQAQKIINWAASESNAHGAHMQALTHAIENGNLPLETIEHLENKMAEWVLEHDKRLKGAA